MLKPYAHLAPDQQLGALRGQELRNAADILGLTGLHYLGYRDSGMPGTEPNRDPRAFINADPDRVTGQIVKIIRTYQPQVVVTFDPFGGYGHPDHIFIHHRATEAFQAAGDAARYPEAGAPYQPQKLYWSVFPKRLLKFLVLVLRVTRRDPTKFGRNGDIDLKEIAAHDYPPTTHVNIRSYYDIKQAASQCHISQLSGGPARFGKLQKWFMMSEHFRLVEPAVNGKRLKERDLFEEVQL
jgi:mycothiol S-conjugate amidase